MLKNYFKIALRNLRKSKTYSFINITGLSAGLAVSILLLLWVNDELGYDRFNVHAANLYRLSPKFGNESNPTIWDNTPAPIAVYAKKEIPEVEDACRVTEDWTASVFEYQGKKVTEWHNCRVDPSFFSMFTYPLIKGNPQQPFTDAHSVVLSETTAKRCFGDEDPMGKVLKADDKKIYQVTGVMKDMPENSSIQYNMVFNFQQLEQEYDTTGYFKTLNSNWGQYNYTTYVLLKPRANPIAAGKKTGAMHRRIEDIDVTKNLVYLLSPLAKIQLYASGGTQQGMMIVRGCFIVAG